MKDSPRSPLIDACRNGTMNAPRGLSGAPHAPVRRSKIWPGMIFALIGLNMTIVGFTIYFATADRSVATEPDYYAKALNYDAEIKLREASRALGWTASAALRPAADQRGMDLTITLADHEGKPIDGAQVSAVVFANVRSGNRQKLKLVQDSSASVYAAPVRIDRSGIWHVRVSAVRGDQAFARETDLLVPGQ